jgi:hypothetical protein
MLQMESPSALTPLSATPRSTTSPCETVGALAQGISQAVPLKWNENPNMAGLMFVIPRPLSPGIKVTWTIKSEDEQPIEVRLVQKVAASALPQQ